MSTEESNPSPREQLLAEVYAQADGARDRTRAVERFMQVRAATARPRRGRSRQVAWPSAAAVAVCVLAAGLAWRAGNDVESAAALAPTMPVDTPAASLSVAVEAPARPGAAAADAAPALTDLEDVVVMARKREREGDLPPTAAPMPVLPEAAARALPEPELGGELAARRMPREERPVPLAGAPTPLVDERAPAAPSMPDPRALVALPPAAVLASPITLGAPSAERMRELEGQRGNDMAEVLPALGSATVDPCAKPERVGAAIPEQGTDEETRATHCPATVER